MEKLYHIGRDRNKNDIYIIDESVSSTHAQVFIDNKIDLYIVDLSSKNGVYVNGNKINESTILENNDKISLGNFSFTKEDLLEAIKIYENLKREGKQKNISLLPSSKKVKKSKSNNWIYILIVVLLGVIGAGTYFLNSQKSIKDIISKPSESSQENTEIKKEITQPKEKEKTETREDKSISDTKKQRTEVTYDFSCLINEKDELGTSLILDFGDLTRDVQSDLLSEVEITINDEIEAGNEYLIDVKNESTLTTSGKDYSKLKKIMDDLVSRLSNPRGFNYKIYLVEEDIENAFTIGGKIFFYRGMYNFLKNDSELSALISHEISHNELGHSILALKKNKAASEFGILGEIALIFEGMTTVSFNQKQEAEADLFGADLIAASNYNNCSVVSVWERFASMEGDFDENENLFSSHPYSQERANCVKNHYKNNYDITCN